MMDRSYTVFRGDQIIEEGTRNFDWDYVREIRNQVLEQTDWRAVKDRTMSQAWKDYRQALRDLPQTHESANEAADNWPIPPE